MASLGGIRTIARAQRSTAMFAAIADVLVASLPPLVPPMATESPGKTPA